MQQTRWWKYSKPHGLSCHARTLPPLSRAITAGIERSGAWRTPVQALRAISRPGLFVRVLTTITFAAVRKGTMTFARGIPCPRPICGRLTLGTAIRAVIWAKANQTGLRWAVIDGVGDRQNYLRLKCPGQSVSDDAIRAVMDGWLFKATGRSNGWFRQNHQSFADRASRPAQHRYLIPKSAPAASQSGAFLFRLCSASVILP